MNFFKKNWILILILFFSFLIRIFNISTNPPELFSDEITHVLSARTIIQTGHDINGKLNLYLYNRLKLGAPVYGYIAATSTFIFGDNIPAVRLPAVLAGTLTVFLIYQLCFLFTKNKTVALLSAFIAAITPWNIYFSRIAWEPSLILPFILSGILAFYSGINSKGKNKIILPYIIFAIAVYGADALEFLAPVFLIVLIIINFKKVWSEKNIHVKGLLVFILLLVPYFLVVANNPLKYGRSLKISTFATGVNTKNIEVFAHNYFAHLSPTFLFEKGDPNLRQGTGSDGVLYWAIMPFVLIGLIYSIINVRKRDCLFLLIWFMIFPLGGSLTNDGVPHATRTLIGDPVFIILFAVGYSLVLSFIKSKKYKIILNSLLILTLLLEFITFANSYFIYYPINSQPWWDYGERKIFLSIKANTKGSESLCLPNVEYWHEDTYPNYYLGVGNNYKMTFYLDDPECLKSDVLVLPVNSVPPKGYKKIDEIKNLEGQTFWVIYKSASL